MSRTEEEVVILLHGIARTHRSLAGLARSIEGAGFRTWSATYPSRRMPIAGLAADIAARVKREAPAEAYHAVTHSLGGIIVRHMRDALPWSRVVMLAPPNQGTRVGRTLQKQALYRWLLGPAGQDLAQAADWPMPPSPFAVIAGTKNLALANPTSWLTSGASLFPADMPNDGTVSVEETKLPGMSAFAEVDATHTFIMNHPRAAALVISFLRHGTFEMMR